MSAAVTINQGCINGGERGIALLATKNSPIAPDKVFYWVLVPSIHPDVPYWYGGDCLTVDSGTLPDIPAGGSATLHRIQKGANVATFAIDHATKLSLIANGFSVTFLPAARGD